MNFNSKVFFRNVYRVKRLSEYDDNCIPEKRNASVSVRRDFLVFNLQATFPLEFVLNFANGLLWQRSSRTIILLAQESKLCSGESKTSQISTNFDYCIVFKL